VAAALSPEEKQYDPRDLVRMLALACVGRGVRLRECTQALGFETSGDRVTGVRTATEVVSCGQVVIAGGAWSDQLARWLSTGLPVYPVRGQILALRCVPSPLRYTIYAHAGYLVPRVDGEVLVGATAEHEAGFDTRPTAGGMSWLLQAGIALVPALAEAQFDRVWAGLRPGCRDNLPILGPLPGWSNVQVAAGHFRNGVLLAPITAEVLAAGLVHGEEHPLLAWFRAERFA
jgi:glycine oxidase